ncbi:MAG: hypothetical protein DRJ51_07745 [Thermoprotei archaeon]|nr:MAG: hypothetical protein DRJ51_07745 [Thermoprotei archaeon]
MIRAVIFDLDGTLLIMKLKVREAKERLIQRLKEIGVNIDRIDPKLSTEEIILETMKEYGFSRNYLMKLVDESYIPYELQAAEAAELREGVKEVLKELKAVGFKLAVASNSARRGVHLALENVSIKDLFDVIVTRSDVNRMKPDGALIAETLRRLNVKPSEAVYIGDTVHDILAARRVGVKSIAISGGAHSISLILNSKPDILIKDIKELPRVLKELARRGIG